MSTINKSLPPVALSNSLNKEGTKVIKSLSVGKQARPLNIKKLIMSVEIFNVDSEIIILGATAQT